jgi:hypothetical protein
MSVQKINIDVILAHLLQISLRDLYRLQISFVYILFSPVVHFNVCVMIMKVETVG